MTKNPAFTARLHRFTAHLRKTLSSDAVQEDAVIGKDPVRVEAEHELLIPSHVRRLKRRVQMKLRHCMWQISFISTCKRQCQGCGLIVR